MVSAITGQDDGAFGTAGRVELGGVPVDTFPARVYALKELSGSGYLALADGAQPNQLSLVRVLSTGALDATFGVTGSAALPALTGGDDKMRGSKMLIAVQPDGKAVLSVRDASNRPALLRVTESGAVDTTFGVAGRVPLIATSWGVPTILTMTTTDDRITVFGVTSTGTFVARFWQ